MEIHRRAPQERPYSAPRKNVLLLSCMDLRFIDDIGHFMEGDNLVNRYDQLVFAGSALGVMQPKHQAWRKVFFQHLDIAVELHSVKDVYIMEHRNCGAYPYFLGPKYDFDDSPLGREAEELEHKKHAFDLRDAIQAHCKQQIKEGGKKEAWTLNIRSFLMDLRGSVHMLDEDAEHYEF
jgi:carbonic anhydrase